MGPLDRLQELLDERGVKYERRSFVDYGRDSVEYVIWRGIGGLEFNAIRSYSDPDMLYIDNTIISPEDAVGVTVGRGTCHVVKTWSDSDYDEGWRYHCSECGCPIPVDERAPETGDVISAANYCPHCGARVAGR